MSDSERFMELLERWIDEKLGNVLTSEGWPDRRTRAARQTLLEFLEEKQLSVVAIQEKERTHV